MQKAASARVEQPYGIFFIYTYWIYTDHLPAQRTAIHTYSFYLRLFCVFLFVFWYFICFFGSDMATNYGSVCIVETNTEMNRIAFSVHRSLLLPAPPLPPLPLPPPNQTNEMAEQLQKP